MLFIEKIGQNFVYRSRDCSFLVPRNDTNKKCHSCKILTENLCKSYNENEVFNEEYFSKIIKEESHCDSFDYEYDDISLEQETKVKSEADLKPTVISFYSEKEIAQKKKSKKLHNHK